MLRLMNDEPILTLWFGNFYRPAFDDKEYIDRSMELIRELGFNCVELDSKAWKDFDERYRGGEASQYVAAQEYMMESSVFRKGRLSPAAQRGCRDNNHS